MPTIITLSNLAPGTYILDDDGILGNNRSVVRDSNGVILFAFDHPADSLTIDSYAGQNLIFNIADSFGAADINVGGLTDATWNADSIQVRNIGATTGRVTLASNGAITELGSDAAADIVAGALILSAGTGIGTTANALETQVSAIEAETNTGGIAITNFGNLTVGGLSSDVGGLSVLTSGDINFRNYGSIVLADETGPESVRGGSSSGNVTLAAIGYDSDLISDVPNIAIHARHGDVVLMAGREIAFGTGAPSIRNDVFAFGAITLTAGRDVIVTGFADIFSDFFITSGGAPSFNNSGGGVTVTAGRSVGISNGAVIASNGSGDVVVNTGAGGILSLLAQGFAPLSSFLGDIILNADRIEIAANSAIRAENGMVTIRPVTAGRAVDLGSVTDTAFSLELSDVELDRIFTDVLVIGDGNSGSVTVSSAITVANAPDLVVRSGVDIAVRSTLTAQTSISLQASDDVLLFGSAAIGTGAFSILVDTPNVDTGVGARTILGGTVGATSIAITGAGDDDLLNGTNEADTINGAGGNDLLNGRNGNDVINGGTGADAMFGGTGDDAFAVDNLADTVDEQAGQGFDRVFTSVSYALAANSHVEILSTDGYASTAALNLTGSNINNELYGNAGANVLIGRGGADIMYGMGGDDSYSVDNAGDVVVEVAGGGLDRVFTSVSYALAVNSHVEILSTDDYASTAAINLTGSNINNELYGNAGANVLVGRAGADLMSGMGGDDAYSVDNAADIVEEMAGAGLDRVFTSVSYALASNSHVEILSSDNYASTAAMDLTGSFIANELYGNAGANLLDGKGGNDMLYGKSGADTFAFTTAPGAGNVDVIADFVAVDDTIALDDAVFAGLPLGGLSANAFRSGSAATDADDRIIYNPATGALFFDADGNGAGAQIQFATMAPGLVLSASDFAVI